MILTEQYKNPLMMSITIQSLRRKGDASSSQKCTHAIVADTHHHHHHQQQQQQHLSHDICDNEEKNEGEKISNLKWRQSGLSIEIDRRQAEGDLHNGLHCTHKCQQNCKVMTPASADFKPVARRRRVQKSSNPIHHRKEKSKIGDCDDHSVHQTWCKSSKSAGQLGFPYSPYHWPTKHIHYTHPFLLPPKPSLCLTPRPNPQILIITINNNNNPAPSKSPTHQKFVSQ